jgi:cardiolipin synthase
VALINAAQERLWIANPYLVPPETLQDAIIMAAMRGVDVRIIVPSYSDALTVMLASKIYQETFLRHGIRIFAYERGFLHQKVMLVDSAFGVVGSANFDFRSMFINFEITSVTTDRAFNEELEAMLLEDFAQSRELSLDDFEQRPLLHQLATKGANLMAPVL